MEFHQKLQELRKRSGLTQEELAQALFVSRTAVSKWESGRGYPSIDSLKAIAGYFSVSIDQLLSGDELLSIAQEDSRQRETDLRTLFFGLMDVSAAAFFFLPLLGQHAGGAVQAVSLPALTGAAYLTAAYYSVVIVLVLFGILTLALQRWRQPIWECSRHGVSLALSSAGMLLFILSRQPYAAAFLFLLLAVKALMALRRP